MSVSPIDSLLQISPPTRANEPSSSVERGRAFGPALEQAYQSDQPRESPAPAESEEADLEPTPEIVSDEAPTSYETADDRMKEAEGPADPLPDVAEEAEADDESEADEVEISVAAGELGDDVTLTSGVAAVNAALLEVNLDSGQVATLQGIDGEGQADEASASLEEGALPEGPSKPDSAAARGQRGDAEAAEFAEEPSMTKHATTAVKDAGDAKRGNAEAVAADAPRQAESQSAAKSQPAATESAQTQTGEARGTDAEATALQPVEAEGVERGPKDDGTEQVKAQSVSMTAEVAAAIEQRLAPLEQSGEVATQMEEVSTPQAVESTGPTTSTQRTAATLDLLTAASMRRAEGPASQESGPPIDRPRFVERVEGALRAAQQRDGRVQVRLAPPELGSLHIELAVQNGVMTAKVEAETPAARNALLDNLPALRDRLAEQNIRIEKFDVDVRRDSHGGGGGAPNDKHADHNESGSQERRGRAAAPAAKTQALKAARVVNSASNSGLDVRI